MLGWSQLKNNAVTVSDEQQRDSAINIHVSVLCLISCNLHNKLEREEDYYPCFIAAETKAWREVRSCEQGNMDGKWLCQDRSYRS